MTWLTHATVRVHTSFAIYTCCATVIWARPSRTVDTVHTIGADLAVFAWCAPQRVVRVSALLAKSTWVVFATTQGRYSAINVEGRRRWKYHAVVRRVFLQIALLRDECGVLDFGRRHRLQMQIIRIERCACIPSHFVESKLCVRYFERRFFCIQPSADVGTTLYDRTCASIVGRTIFFDCYIMKREC